MPERVYLVMRDEGLQSDGYYYESNTSVVGIRTTYEAAYELLNEIANKLYPDSGWKRVEDQTSDKFRLEHDIVFDLTDMLWIESRFIGKAGDVEQTMHPM